MATRPGIRTGTLNQGYNTVGRPTSPAADRGSGVKRLNSALAGSQKRTQILATGRRGNLPQSVPVGTAATALGTVLTQGTQQIIREGSEGAQALGEAIKTSLVENVPLVEIPGINAPVAANPVEFVGAVIKTSEYSPELVNEARVRAEKGDVLSKIYVGAADTLIKGADNLYQRVQGPGYTPASKSMAGVLKSAAGALGTVPAILQAGNYLINPQKLVYDGVLPKTVSGVSIDRTPRISGDSVTVSIEDTQAANAVLGTVATSAGELVKQEGTRFVDAVITEAKQNPYGLAGQILGGAILAKGAGSILPKKVPNAKIEGEPTTPSRVTGGGSTKGHNIGGGNVVVNKGLTKGLVTTGLAGGAAVLSETGTTQKTPTMPQKVVTYTFTNNNSFIDDLIDDYPQKPVTGNQNETGNTNANNSNNNNKNAGGTLVIRPVEFGNVLRIDGGMKFKSELTPRIEYVKITEIMGENTGNKNTNRYQDENAESTRTQNRVQEEFVFEYPTVTPTRPARTRRKIDIDIELPKRTQKKRVKKTKKYAKRQIVNPLPWLWDEEPSFSRKLPQKVEMVSVDTLLA